MATKKAAKSSAKRYVIVRTYSAGVHAGVLESRSGKEVVLTGARRLWYWKGAMCLNDLAVLGTKNPGECRFGVPVRIELTEAIEIIDTSAEGRASIEAVKPWTA
jgi:hypothetical protein